MTRLLTISQAADQLGVSPSTVRRLIERKELRVCRFAGRIIRVSPDAIAEFIECSTATTGHSSTDAPQISGTSVGPSVAALIVSLRGQQTGA